MGERNDLFALTGDGEVAVAAGCLLKRVMAAMAAAKPLVHCLTNEVVTHVTANALLACGASPLMVVEEEECRAMAAQAEGLLVNIGTFSAERASAMLSAIDMRHAHRRPWVFDPVAVGALAPRSAWAAQLLERCAPTVVRGNASEVIALAGGNGGRGTDSTASAEEAIGAAHTLLSRGVSAVAISGATDIIVTAAGTIRVQHGHPLLTHITGAGCMLGALMAALAGLPEVTPGEAALAGTLWFTLAAEHAAGSISGPGSLNVALIDALHALAQGTVALPNPLRVTQAAVAPPRRSGACAPRPAIAMTIAGTDPTGGAGLPADVSTFRALGVFGVGVITAVVAQNTLGVSGTHPLTPDMVKAQMTSVFDDIEVDAIKIGMLGDVDLMEAVTDRLLEHGDGRPPQCDIVLDPVMVSTSGHALLAPQAVQRLWTRLIPLAGLITPNLAEAEALLGRDIAASLEGLETAALELKQRGAKQVLLKGGHLSGREATDIFVEQCGQVHRLSAPRVDTPNTHGTGCVLSSAITALRAQGYDWLDAIVLAKRFLHEALKAGQHERFTLGSGPCLIHLPLAASRILPSAP